MSLRELAEAALVGPEEADWIFTRAATPQTILALLDVVEAAQRLDKVLDLASSVHTPERRAARLALRAALAALPEDVL